MIAFALQQRRPLPQLLAAHGVWDKRKPMIRAGLKRHSLTQLQAFLARCAEVDQQIKGQLPGDSLVLKELGGTVGDITQSVVGGPRFSAGERNLLFLVPADEPERYRTYALELGKVVVRNDPQSGRDVAVVHHGVTPHGRPGDQGETALGSTSTPHPLEDVISRLERHLQASGGN